jgi:hypothetical protein
MGSRKRKKRRYARGKRKLSCAGAMMPYREKDQFSVKVNAEPKQADV